MRRLLLLTGAMLVVCHLALGGIVIAGRITDATACLQYRMFEGAKITQGVIDANTGKAAIDRRRVDRSYILSSDEGYTLYAERRGMGHDDTLGSLTMSLDLMLTPSTLFIPERERTYTLLQQGLTVPLESRADFNSIDLSSVFAGSIAIGAHQLAIRWLSTNLIPNLTLVNEDGTNHRAIELYTELGLDRPIAWSADEHYLLMQAESTDRFKLHAILDTQTMKSVLMPATLRLPDAAYWQIATWSPTQPQIAAIRLASSEALVGSKLTSPTQLVLFSPDDGSSHVLDLPAHFYPQQIVWSPTGTSGAVVGLYLPSETGTTSQADAKSYILFSSEGKFTSALIKGVVRSQIEDLFNIQLGAWSADGAVWMYLRKSETEDGNFYALATLDAHTGKSQVLETRIAPIWWSTVFDDSVPIGASTEAMILHADFKRDLLLVTADEHDRLNVELMDTRTWQRARLITGVDQVMSAAEASTAVKLAFRPQVPVFGQAAIPLFSAIVITDGKMRFVWSALDGSQQHELPIHGERFEVLMSNTFRQPLFIYRLQHDNLTDLGIIDLQTGKQTILLHDLMVAESQFITRPDLDRIAFLVSTSLGANPDLYLASLDGTVSKQLATNLRAWTVWNPDEEQLAYMTTDKERSNVMIVDGDGKLIRELRLPLSLAGSGVYLTVTAWTKC